MKKEPRNNKMVDDQTRNRNEEQSSQNSGREPWRTTVLTLFPEMFPGQLGESLAGKALDERTWLMESVDIRKFTSDKHQTVDDTPFGGGPGMVMRPDVVDRALRGIGLDPEKTGGSDRPIIYLTPRGRPLDQAKVNELAMGAGIVVICGRYEGVDERVIKAWEMEEISLGDYILSGGEPAAAALIDACVRLLPGVMGSDDSPVEESFEGGLLEYPQFTKPRNWNCSGKELDIPEILLSGHHENIRAWRMEEAEKVTRVRRPDMWAKYAGPK